MVDIINYLDEKKIENSDCKYLVVSDMSNVISLYYGESHGYYDMPLKGNVGLNGEKELLEGLKDKEG